jgi:hypothetical protein
VTQQAINERKTKRMKHPNEPDDSQARWKSQGQDSVKNDRVRISFLNYDTEREKQRRPSC